MVSFGYYIISYLFSIILFPISIFSSWIIVRPFQEVTVLLYGQYRTTLKKPGIYFFSYFGHTLKRVSTKITPIELPDQYITDKHGSPLLISAVVTYKVCDSFKSALAVGEGVDSFVRVQAEVVLKAVCATYPYEDNDNLAAPSLRVDEGGKIPSELIPHLQERVDAAGVKIIAFELADLKFAPEIAQMMLARQEAKAVLSAKFYVVDGATSLATDTVRHLQEAGVELDYADASQLMGNLVSLNCSYNV